MTNDFATGATEKRFEQLARELQATQVAAQAYSSEDRDAYLRQLVRACQNLPFDVLHAHERALQLDHVYIGLETPTPVAHGHKHSQSADEREATMNVAEAICSQRALVLLGPLING